MFYYSIGSREKVVHYKGCHHIRNIREENLQYFDNIKDVRKRQIWNVLSLIDNLSAAACTANA